MRALVTGGAGFIGSHLVDQLLKLNFEVTVIDSEFSDVNSNFFWNDKVKNFKIDIRDYEKSRPLYTDVDYVFHLAAEARIQPSILNPIQTVSINSLGTCTVLQCAKEAGVKRFIFSSTSAIYGRNSSPNTENQIADCLNPYSISKLNSEMLCKMYSEIFDLPTIILRYFNVFGERQPTQGLHAPVIGVFLNQKSKNLPLTIVGDGSQRRDFVSVYDVVNANILAAQSKIDPQYFGSVFNIGSGVDYSVLEIAQMISQDIIMIESRIGESKQTLADISKAKSILKWTPTTTLSNWLKDK
jgi:UDP-glucose 4-epimerase